MMTAQRLYEGIETDEGGVGLITYMRTDSVTLATLKRSMKYVRIDQRTLRRRKPAG